MRHVLFLLVPALLSAAPVSLRQADEACADGLWEIGAARYQRVLDEGDLPESERAPVSMRLAEALLRSGEPEQARRILAQKAVAVLPDAYFWNAQALVALGKPEEAADLLARADDDEHAPYRAEALLTRSSLLLELGRPADALLALKPLAVSSDPGVAAAARLRRAEILFDRHDIAAAQSALPETDDLDPRHRPEAEFLRGKLALAGGKPAAAEAIFRSLLESPGGTTANRYYAAALALAEALAAKGSRAEAVDFLLDFISDHPEAPNLGRLFDRIARWLPENPKADDPVMVRLAEWIPPLPPPPPGGLPESIGAAIARAAPEPTATPLSVLAPYAMFTRALALHRDGSPKSRAAARSLLTRLRLEYPAHPLASRAMLQQARWKGGDVSGDAALAVLDHLPPGSDDRGEVDFLKASLLYQRGDAAAAAALFDSAADGLSAGAADVARLNGAVLRVSTGGEPQEKDLSPESAADLQLEQALASKTPEAAKNALETFLTGHPRHPREAVARLAAAEAALDSSPPDTATARAQLDAIASMNPPPASQPPAARLALARLLLADRSGMEKEAVAGAKAFLEAFPKDPAAPEVELLLGRVLYQSGQSNEARMILEKLAAADAEPARAQAAWLLAARAAAAVPTPQSREQALVLFDNAIAAKAPLAALARLEKARLLLDLNQAPAAAAMLGPWLESLPKDDPLRLPAGFLLGEALTVSANGATDKLSTVLGLYQKLAAGQDVGAANRNHLKFLSGQILEQLPDPKTPGKKRVGDAISTYYSVLEDAGGKPPAEWEWFERCGFRALELYAAAERWQPAIAIARKIASFKGPRATEAANQARLLQLKNMVYDD